MELSPFKSITGSDTFWDDSIPNPLSVGIPTSVSQTTPETSVAGLRNHLTSDLHRRFQSLSRGKLGLRVVVSCTTEGTHQPVGDESSSSGIVSFQYNSPSQISGSGNKQYYRSSLSDKPGRHSLFQPVFSLQGDSPSFLGTSDSTGSEAYCGSSQCTSRHTVTFSSTSEHGMGIPISNF